MQTEISKRIVRVDRRQLNVHSNINVHIDFLIHIILWVIDSFRCCITTIQGGSWIITSKFLLNRFFEKRKWFLVAFVVIKYNDGKISRKNIVG